MVQKYYLLALAGAVMFVVLAVVTWFQLDQDAEPEIAKAATPAPTATAPPAGQRADVAPAVKAGAGAAAGSTAPARSKLAAAAAENNQTAPSFDVVHIAKDGSAVIAGRAQPGADVKIALEGKEIASAKADKRGEWVMVIERPLPSGSTQLELSAKTPKGKEIAAESVLAVVIPGRETTPGEGSSAASASGGKRRDGGGAVAIVVPDVADKAIKILQPPRRRPGGALSVDIIDYGEREEIVISGAAPPGARIRIYVDDLAAGDVTADGDGQWRMTPAKPIAAGTHLMRVDQLSETGKVIMRVELPFERMSPQVLRELLARRRVIVQPGNSLWRIARRVYGQGVQYTTIYAANAQTIKDPELIYPGQVFDLPQTN